MPYGYDPKDYILDYSWIGDIGDKVANVARKFPSLLKLNKEIHENKEYNTQAKAAMSEHISGMSDQIAMDIATELGYNPTDVKDAKLKMISKIPEPGSEMPNGEYTKRLAEDHLVPIFRAAKTIGEKNPDRQYTYGDILKTLQSGKVEEAFAQTATGKMASERSEYDRRQEASYQDFTRKEEFKGEQTKVREDEKMQQEQQLEQQSAIRIKSLVQFAGSNPMAVFDANIEEVTPEEQTKAFNAILRNKQLDAADLVTKMRAAAPKTVSPDARARMMDAANRNVGTIADDIAALKSKKKEKKISNEDYEVQLGKLKSEEVRAKKNRNILQEAMTEFENKGGSTQKELTQEQAAARQNQVTADMREIERYQGTNFGKKAFDWIKKQANEEGYQNKQSFESVVGIPPVLKEDGKTLDLEATKNLYEKTFGMGGGGNTQATPQPVSSVNIPADVRAKIEAEFSKNPKFKDLSPEKKELVIQNAFKQSRKQ